jgi:SAM-dependent methyltransferase|tara:strand:- start:279 stop:971 length:693 start_codon:yes stop_codon:yes gene_type:complete
MDESQRWNEFAEDYDRKIFSLTSFPERRKQILDRIVNGRVLNLGTGSTDYLNRDLVNEGNVVVATDFCKKMLDVASKRFSHFDLEYKLADSTALPFQDNTFDSVVSVNSILPPERYQVFEMFNEAYRVLKDKGVLVAFLCSYDNVKIANKNLNAGFHLDDLQQRIIDTTTWQCFHTPSTIEENMLESGFSKYGYEKVFLNTCAEISEFRRLYHLETEESPIYEYLLVAEK